MSDEKNTPEQEQELQEEYSSGIMDLSTGAQVGIAAGFIGLPLLAGAAEVLHLGFTGFAVGAVGAGAIGLVGKHVMDQQKASGHNINIPAIERLRNANWGA